jgi:hypothetical protein
MQPPTPPHRVQAIRSDRRFIGIETEPKYFDMAVNRIEKELGRHPLFPDEPSSSGYTQIMADVVVK